MNKLFQSFHSERMCNGLNNCRMASVGVLYRRHGDLDGSCFDCDRDQCGAEQNVLVVHWACYPGTWCQPLLVFCRHAQSPFAGFV